MRSTAIIFGLLALIAGAASQAAVPGDEASARVVTNDLDLNTTAGRTTLSKRLGIAAAEVCGEASASDPAARRAVRACRLETAQRALGELSAHQVRRRLAAR